MRKYFHLSICHINDCDFPLTQIKNVFLRNTGPQALHQKQLQKMMGLEGVNYYSDLGGKGDIKGKSHLLELFNLKYPVIPTIDDIKDITILGDVENFLIKPLNGADSNGVEIVQHKDIIRTKISNCLVQPYIEFEYEVSFYFINDQFHYALYGADKFKRWELSNYTPSQEDIAFAQKFINWNSCKYGIQRVDACRTMSGDLWLMELEDYNPYLSLDLLQKNVKRVG